MSNTVRVTDKFDAPCLCGRLIPFSDSDKSKTHNIDQVVMLSLGPMHHYNHFQFSTPACSY